MIDPVASLIAAAAAPAANVGVLLHALAGDEAAKDGERGTVAGDLLPHLRAWANPKA